MKRYVTVTRSHLLAGIAAVAVFILTVLIAEGFDTAAVPVSGFGGYAKLPVYGVESAKKQVALTFNAAWEADDIGALLALLKERNVTCTFFLVGQWAEKNPREARRIVEAGHEIGNHSYAHPNMTNLSKQGIAEDITKAQEAIANAAGVTPKLFRAPSGAYNDTVVEAAQSMGLSVIQWSVDSVDWKKPDPESLAARVLKKAEPGAIVLMHTGLENTRAALPRIIDGLREQGYSFVTVGELLVRGAYTIDHEGIQHPAKPDEN